MNNNIIQGKAGTGLLLLSGLVLLVSLVFALINLGTEGHAAFNTSSVLPWGQPIATYLSFCAGLVRAGSAGFPATGIRVQAVLPGGQALHLSLLHHP